MATKKVILKEIVDGVVGNSIHPQTSIEQVEGLEDALRAAGSVSTVSVNNGTPIQPVNKNINITVPEDLADLNEDSTHQTVTAAQKTEWSNKSTFSGNYNDLTNKPTIPSAITEGTVSEWGFTKNTGTYSKPNDGIPSTDLASAVQTSLGKADTAIQSVTVGTTTTGAAGSSASVTNTGTATEPVLSFTIPQGAQGIQGIQGPQGERGPQGNTGVQVDSVASIIHSIDPTATYAAADVAGADAVQDVLSELTELEGGVYNSLHTTIKTTVLDLSQYSSVKAWRDNDGWWTTKGYGKFIPVTPGNHYYVRAHQSNSTYCCMSVGDNTSAPLASNSSLIEIPANSESIIVAPEDALFLWVSGWDSTYTRLPQSVIEHEEISVAETTKHCYKKLPEDVYLSNIAAVNAAPSGTGKWINNSNNWFGKFIYVKGYRKVEIQTEENSTIFLFLTDGSWAINSSVHYAEGYAKNGRTLAQNTKNIIDVPLDASYLFVWVTQDNYATSLEPTKVILKTELVTADELDQLSTSGYSMPSFIEFGENEGVMYTIDNFIMKHIYENNIEYLCFSTDLGNNWTQIENTFNERITHAHYFIDGTLLMCTPTKCYWTKDFQTFTESVVYDYDGSLFQPESGTRFYNIPKYKEKRTFIGNEEWHLWGDYIISTTRPRLWYTKDNGRTIRAAFAFGLSSIDGTVYSARHIHAFEYNPYDGYFYAFTGDAANECHIIKGQYNNDTWTWEHIVTGALWKLTSPVFFNGYFAAVTDYTDSSLSEKKGLVRCPTNAISEENICYLFKATSAMMGTAALSGYIYDKNGWRVICCDYLGQNRVLIAKNSYNFAWVDNIAGKKINWFLGPNANGDVYATYGDVGASVSGESWLKINVSESFNFTEAMRDAGAKNFFDYRITEF